MKTARSLRVSFGWMVRANSLGLLVFLWLCVASHVNAESSTKRGSNSAPSVSAEAAQRAGLTQVEAVSARKLYTTKCMRCHKSYEPAEYSQIRWDSWMVKMRKKARLNSDQDQLLSHYLDAYRSGLDFAKTNRAESNAKPTSYGAIEAPTAGQP